MTRKIPFLLTLLLSLLQTGNTAAQDIVLDCSYGKTHAGGTGHVSIYLRNKDISIASVQFNFFFDTDNLRVQGVNGVYRAEDISFLEWENIEGGIHVGMTDSLSTIEAGTGAIAKIIIQTNFATPIGTYDLVVTNAMLCDSLGNEIPSRTANGEFDVISSADIWLMAPAVSPGSIGNWVGVGLNTYVFIESVQFDLNYDTHNFAVAHVEQPSISDRVFPVFSWSHIDEGIHVFLSDATSTFQSSEYLVSVYFDVKDHVVRDSSYNLILDNVVLIHSSGHEVPTRVKSGGLFVPSHDVYVSVDGFEGEQGSDDNNIRLFFNKSLVDVTFLKLDLLYDTDNLWISRVETTAATAAFTNIGWNNIPGGSRIFMSDDGAVISPGGYRSIAYLFFDIAPDAPPGDYDLILSEVVLLDTLGNEILTTTTDGNFHVYPTVDSMVMTVVNGAGFPRSRRNVVPIDLANWPIAAVSIDLLFDTEYFLVSEVKKTSRTSRMGIFAWTAIDAGIRIQMTGEWGIRQGTGSIADVYFDVHEKTPFGDYSLTIDTAFVANHLGVEIPTDFFDGTFSVVQQGDVNGDGSIDLTDIILTINIILGIHEPIPAEFSVADCNDDDVVNILDVVCIVNIILGSE